MDPDALPPGALPPDALPPDALPMRTERDIGATMRDGTRLSLRICRPDAPGRFPALLAVSPYQHVTDDLPHSPLFLWREVGPVPWYVAHGYACVHADVRGTGQSEGRYGFLDRAEQQDLYDLVQWVAAQDWCDGNVGGIGQSYYAWSQWFMGVMAPPALRCIAPYDGATDIYRDAAYHGGIHCDFMNWWYTLIRNNNLHRAGPEAQGRLLEADLGRDFTTRQLRDDWWRERSAQERLDRVRVPVLSIGHWGKMSLHLRGNITGFEALQAPKRLIVTGARDVFEAHDLFDQVSFHAEVLKPFYDRYLKGAANGWEDGPAVRLWLRGRDDWLDADRWPLPQARETAFHLQPGPAGAGPSLNDGALGPEPMPGADGEAEGAATSYDYPDPQWTLGTARLTPEGPDAASRVLAFSTPELDRPLEIAGPVRLLLWLSSTATDTDVFVRLVDVPPGGRPVIVSRGWLRASHRRTDPARGTPWRPFRHHDAPEPLEPGRPELLEIEVMPCAHRFAPGHRLRLEIANGDSPVTEGLFTHLYGWWKVGRDTIHHDAAHPSRLLLPVLPEG